MLVGEPGFEPGAPWPPANGAYLPNSRPIGIEPQTPPAYLARFRVWLAGEPSKGAGLNRAPSSWSDKRRLQIHRNLGILHPVPLLRRLGFGRTSGPVAAL